MSPTSRIGFPAVIGFYIFFQAVVPARSADADEPSIQDIFKAFREKQSSERIVAGQDKERLLSHIAKIKELRANASAPKDAREIKALDQELDHDTVALARTEERIHLAEMSIQGEFVGVPISCFGLVEREAPQGWEPVETHTPITADEVIRTAGQSSVELVFEDGNQVKVWPESSFKLQKKTESETDYELLSGKIHVRYHAEAVAGVISQVAYHTVSVDAPLPGGEFYLSLDNQNHTHVTMMSGKMELTAQPVQVSDFNPPWWAQSLPPPDPEPLIYGHWFRVALIKGDVEMIRADGIPRRAVVGAELSRSEKLTTGRDGWVWGQMDGDSIGAMKPGSTLNAGLIRKKLVYGLGAGTFYFVTASRRRATDMGPEFRSPTARARVSGAEFEATVDEKGETDFVPLEGMMEVTAVY